MVQRDTIEQSSESALEFENLPDSTIVSRALRKGWIDKDRSITLDRLKFIKGQPTYFASSAKGKRDFCANCGTALIFSSSDYPDDIDVTVCSMDCPDNLSPDYHIWTASQRHWLHLNDGLRSYLDAGPDVPAKDFKF